MTSNSGSSPPRFHPPDPSAYGLESNEIEILKAYRDKRKRSPDDTEGQGTCFLVLIATIVLFLCWGNYALEHAPWLFLVPLAIWMLISILIGAVDSIKHRTYEQKLPALESFEKEYWKVQQEFEERDREYREAQEHTLRKKMQHWLELSGIQFENEIGKVFRHAGYDVQVTSPTRDQGIDLIVTKGGETMVIQCKAHKKPVGLGAVRELYGSLKAQYQYQRAIALLVTIQGVTSGAQKFAEEHNIVIWDIRHILKFNDKYPPNSSR